MEKLAITPSSIKTGGKKNNCLIQNEYHNIFALNL